MSSFAPPPAEEYSDSDSDEFSFADVTRNATNPAVNVSSATANRGGFLDLGANNSNGNGSWTVGGEGASKKLGPPKSQIPVASPTNNGVNIEDFRLAVIRGSTELVAKCIEQGVDVNVTFKTGWTPLMYASHQVNEPLMSLLLNNGATLNQEPTTALMTCCTSNVKNREEEIERCINLLISRGAEVNALDKYAVSPLMMASKKGHIAAIQVLISAGAEVNKEEKRGFTPLCWACSSGNLACIKILVQNGADVNVKTLEGQSPWNIAQSSSHFPQISAYFTSLPEFQKDKYDDGVDWVNPSPPLSNGTSAPSTQQPEAAPPKFPTVAEDARIEDARIDTVYNKFGDLEVFLYGLDLSSLIPCFHNHNITIDHLLNITDDELIKIGVVSVGHRKQILDSVHELHKKDWQPSSISSYDKVKSTKQLSCAEVTTIVANVASHSACITASLKYLTSQVQSNPSLLQVDKHGRGLHALRRFLHEMKGNSSSQVAACSQLKSQIEKTLDGGAAATDDHITRETTNISSNSLIVYSSALITLGVVSLGVYVLSKRFPHFKFPFTR